MATLGLLGALLGTALPWAMVAAELESGEVLPATALPSPMLGVIGVDCPWGLVLDCPWGLVASEGLLETAPLLAMLLVTGLFCVWALNVAALLSLRGLLVGEVAGSSICITRNN